MIKIIKILLVFLVLFTPTFFLLYTHISLQQSLYNQVLSELHNDLVAEAGNQNRQMSDEEKIFKDISVLTSTTSSWLNSISSSPYKITEVHSFLNSYLTTYFSSIFFDSYVAASIIGGNQRMTLELKNGKPTKDSPLGKITFKMHSQMQKADIDSKMENKPNYYDITLPIAHSLHKELGFFILPDFIRNNRIKYQNIYLRESHSQSKKRFSSFKYNNILLSFVIDYDKTNHINPLDFKAKSYRHKNYKLLLRCNKTQDIFASSGFEHQPQLLESLQDYLKNAGEEPETLQIANHLVVYSGKTSQKSHSIAIVSELPPRFRINTFLYIAFVYSVFAVLFFFIISKTLIQKGRFALTITKSIIISFFLTFNFPLFNSFYLANDYILSNFLTQKNTTAQELENSIINVDLLHISNLRNEFIKAKSIDSIETVYSSLGLTKDDLHSVDDMEVVEEMLERIIKTQSFLNFHELFVYGKDEKFKLFKACIERDILQNISSDQTESHVSDKIIKGVIDDLLKPMFNEYLGIKPNTGNHQTPSINPSELKSETAFALLLEMLGHSTYYNLLSNIGYLIQANFLYYDGNVLSVPVNKNGTLQYVFTWFYNFRDWLNIFPVKHLKSCTDNSDSPLLIFYDIPGRAFTKPDEIYNLIVNAPQLLELAIESQSSMTRIVKHLSDETKNQIIEATPSQHSNLILFGQKTAVTFEQLSKLLSIDVLKLVFIILVVSLTIALATSLYFLLPIKFLIKAVNSISNNDFSSALHEAHPDDFALIAQAFNKMKNGIEEGTILKNFVSKSVEQIAEQQAQNEQIDTINCNATILFSGIKNFKALQQQITPDELLNLLQSHLSSAIKTTSIFGGEIEKMIEDKVMMVFRERDTQEPKTAALKAASFLSEEFAKSQNLKLGIGINSGKVISGLMGAEKVYLAETVIGDPVNLAARLADLANGLDNGGIVTTDMESALNANLKVVKLDVTKVKGKAKSIEAYQII